MVENKAAPPPSKITIRIIIPSPPILLYWDIVLSKIMEITEQNFKNRKKVPLTDIFMVFYIRETKVASLFCTIMLILL